MNNQPKIGLLPLYLKLYDDRQPELRTQFAPFLETIAHGFKTEGVTVVRGEVCRVASEFATAIEQFETERVDLIVSVHLAYSPSLEAADVLGATDLPLLMLDTTMDYDYGFAVAPDRLMFNHGIHGVQDLASVLRRRGKAFQILAGHVTQSDLLSRAAECARAAYATHRLRNTHALRIGTAFTGMGDFAVSDLVLLETLGVTVDEVDSDTLANRIGEVSNSNIEAELISDRAQYECDLDENAHRRSVRVGLGLRNLLESEDYSAFSMNFLAFNSKDEPVDTVPFLEASKAMARGVGYAGEGDILTAALVGALSKAFGRTTFTEIFCPDWKGSALFLSHMGEVNPDVAAAKPRICEKPFPFTNTNNPAILVCAPRPGPAVLVNLAPGPHDSFRIILAPVEVLQDATHPGWFDWVRAWVKPRVSIERFLEQYSELGGTHHSALVLGARLEALEAFGRFAGLDTALITDCPH